MMPWPGHFNLHITSLFVFRNINCGYSFSKLEREEHFEIKIEQIRLQSTVSQDWPWGKI